MTEFFAMGGYAAYVWSCFGLTFAVLVANVLVARGAQKKMLHEITGREGSTG